MTPKEPMKGSSFRLLVTPYSGPLFIILSEAALQRCSYEKLFRKYAADLQCNFIFAELVSGREIQFCTST